MPGPYAHITLLHELMKPARLESIFSPASRLNEVLTTCFPFCALGAVSPDYPNLVRHDDTAAQWADLMHCTRACGMIASGIRRVREVKGAVHDKLFAWLLGYCAHVATDVTIHPAVEAKVGAYAENQRQHRICEMNQDSYINRRMNSGEIGETDAFALTVLQCGNATDETRLDRDIVNLWEGMLGDVHPEPFVAHPPRVDSWHREFIVMAAGCAADAVRLFPLAGVIAAKMGLAYSAYDTVDRQYIEEQAVPSECPTYLHYDEIFDRAVDNVAEVWRQVEQAVRADGPANLSTFGDWNLDTGRDGHGRLVFW